MKKLSIFQPLAVISGQASIHERMNSSDKVNKIETLLTTRQIIKVDKNHLNSAIQVSRLITTPSVLKPITATTYCLAEATPKN